MRRRERRTKRRGGGRGGRRGEEKGEEDGVEWVGGRDIINHYPEKYVACLLWHVVWSW